MENKKKWSAVKCDCKRETLRPCGTSINWDITKIARGAKTQIWWPQEQRAFTADLTLSRHSVLVAEEELQAYELCPNIMCTFMHVWHPRLRHTHTRSYTAHRSGIEKTRFLSPKVQGTLLFCIHSDNQAKSLQQRHFQKRLCIVSRWKETAIEKD